jgi:DNA-binding transcriptional ArsR family regulator
VLSVDRWRILSYSEVNENSNVFGQTLKNHTRAAIFFELVRKPELTATEISKNLGLDVDVVYYHLKLLRKSKLVSDPRVEVKGNYIEKYYSLMPGVLEKYINPKKVPYEQLSTEEFKQLMINALAMLQSTTASSFNRIKGADAETIEWIRSENNALIRQLYLPREKYYEALGQIREILDKAVVEPYNPLERNYVLLALAIPHLESKLAEN